MNKQLIEQIQKEIKINIDNLSQESVMNPELHQKYLTMFYHERKELRHIKRDYQILKKSKTEYYMGKADPEVYKEKPFGIKLKTKTELQEYLDTDSELSIIKERLDDQEDFVSYLHDTVKAISNRYWEIKNIIEWEKHIHGK